MRLQTYKFRDEARQGAFDEIEMFYNPVREHSKTGKLTFVKFKRWKILEMAGV